MRKLGFTLAEVLITLGVIGVVAALTLSVLMQNIQARIRAEQIRTVKYKLTKATEKMNSLGLIGPYDSSAAFVAELQKHLKIAKVCTSSNLRACWPYDNVILQDGKEYEISKVQTGKNFKMDSDDDMDYSSPNVGIVTADGVAMILSFNKKCLPLDSVKEYAWSTQDNKPISNATANCVAAVFEINGTKKPNKLNEDVILFNANGLGSSCAIELDSGKCFGSPFSPTPLTRAQCEEYKDDLGIRNCNFDNDYWAGAVKQCKGVSHMPSPSDLGNVGRAIYEGHPSIGGGGKNYDTSYKPGTSTSLGLPEPEFWLWSNAEESQHSAAYRYFYPNYTGVNGSNVYTRNSGFIQAFCLVD